MANRFPFLVILTLYASTKDDVPPMLHLHLKAHRLRDSHVGTPMAYETKGLVATSTQ